MTLKTLVRERPYGDFTVRLEYVNPNPHEIGSEHEPALLICRPPQSGTKSACIIMLNAAHQYVSDGKRGEPTIYALQQCGVFCRVLNLWPDRKMIFKLVTAILDNLDDLYDMPPYQKPDVVAGEAIVDVNGQKFSAEITH